MQKAQKKTNELLAKLVKCILEFCLSMIPKFLRAQCLFRTCRQCEGSLEAEDFVNIHQEFEARLHLLLDLVRPNEDVGIVLLEAADTREAGQGAAGFVSVEHTEVRIAQWELFVTADTVVEHQKVPRAIHRLEQPLLFLDI